MSKRSKILETVDEIPSQDEKSPVKKEKLENFNPKMINQNLSNYSPTNKNDLTDLINFLEINEKIEPSPEFDIVYYHQDEENLICD